MTDLYRFYDGQNRLLYIGISLHAAMRASQHRADKPWWGDVARMEVERIDADRAKAEAIEAEAIRRERPMHNIKHRQETRHLKVTATVHGGLLTWQCMECLEPVADGEGYLTVYARDQRAYRQWREAQPVRGPWEPIDLTAAFSGIDMLPHWRCVHRACDPHPDDGGYWFDVGRIRTAAQALGWTSHLMGKPWLEHTNWDEVVGRIARQLDPKVMSA